MFRRTTIYFIRLEHDTYFLKTKIKLLDHHLKGK